MLVILSAIIVAVYIGWNLMVKPPEIPQQPDTPPAISTEDTSQTVEDDPVPDEPVPTRREGVYTFALLGKDRESGNTDTIIVVTYDTVEQKVGMVSIPAIPWSTAVGVKTPRSMVRTACPAPTR